MVIQYAFSFIYNTVQCTIRQETFNGYTGPLFECQAGDIE